MEFWEKLVAIQNDLKAPKDKENKFGGFRYRSCEGILEAVKPLLAREGLVLSISDEIVEVTGRVYVKATATITDGTNSQQVTAYAREADTKKGLDPAQVTGTSSSYARKYALNGLFCIDDTKDPDTDEYAYDYHNLILCESCIDERLADVKADAQVEVNQSNFELEEET